MKSGLRRGSMLCAILVLVAAVGIAPMQKLRFDAGTALALAATVTNPPAVYSIQWSFGDGGTAAGVAPTHTYTSAGTYTVMVSVLTAGGSVAQAATTATIAGTAAIAISLSGPYTG